MGTYVLPPARYTDTTSIKTGSCTRQFNVLFCGQSYKAVSINHNLCPQTINNYGSGPRLCTYGSGASFGQRAGLA